MKTHYSSSGLQQAHSAHIDAGAATARVKMLPGSSCMLLQHEAQFTSRLILQVGPDGRGFASHALMERLK